MRKTEDSSISSCKSTASMATDPPEGRPQQEPSAASTGKVWIPLVHTGSDKEVLLAVSEQEVI